MPSSILLEHDVLNTQDVDNYCKEIAAEIEFQEGKNWILKNLRNHILNSSDGILRLVLKSEISLDSPVWAQEKISAGQPIMLFDIKSQAFKQFHEQVQDTVHFFSALFQFANMTVGRNGEMTEVEKNDKSVSAHIISKLRTMTLEQVILQNQKWSNVIGSRNSLGENLGGTIAITFPDGFYFINYSQDQDGLDAMRKDGNDLQNCLRTGHYERSLLNGETIIVSLRTPSNEAVVGLRFTASGKKSVQVAECKGKQNQIPVEKYSIYVVKFLNFMHEQYGVSNICHDLREMHIHFGNRKYGRFRDIANKILVRNGFIIYYTENLAMGYFGDETIVYDPANRSLTGYENERNLLEFLNYFVDNAQITEEDFADHIVKELNKFRIVFANGRFEYFADIGKDYGLMGDIRVIGTVDNSGNGFLHLSNTQGLNTQFLKLKEHRIEDAHYGLFDDDDNVVSKEWLNFFKVKFSNHQLSFAFEQGIFFDENSGIYKNIEEFFQATKIKGIFKHPDRNEYAVLNKDHLLVWKHLIIDEQGKVQSSTRNFSEEAKKRIEQLLSTFDNLSADRDFYNKMHSALCVKTNGNEILLISPVQFLEWLTKLGSLAPFFASFLGNQTPDRKYSEIDTARLKNFFNNANFANITANDRRAISRLLTASPYRLINEKQVERYGYKFRRAMLEIPSLLYCNSPWKFSNVSDELFENTKKQIRTLLEDENLYLDLKNKSFFQAPKGTNKNFILSNAEIISRNETITERIKAERIKNKDNPSISLNDRFRWFYKDK